VSAAGYSLRSSPAGDPALFHLDNRLDLDRYAERQTADADRGARVLLAEHLDEEIRAAIDDLGMLDIVRHGIHHSEQLHDPSHPIEIAKLLLEHRKQVQADKASVMCRLLGRNIGPDLALRDT
jgi:hypothetical protein